MTANYVPGIVLSIRAGDPAKEDDVWDLLFQVSPPCIGLSIGCTQVWEALTDRKKEIPKYLGE